MATNDITGDELRSKAASDKFRENFDRIFKGVNNAGNAGTDSGSHQGNERAGREANHLDDEKDGAPSK